MKTAATVTVAVLVSALLVVGTLALRAPQAQAQEGAGDPTAGGPALRILPGDDGDVWVCWDPVEGAQYVVLRADAVEGPYEPISGLLELPEFLDEEAPEGGAFYRVELVTEEPGSRERDLPAEDPEEVYAEITALMDQGRYQEAADLAEAFLAGYGTRNMARQKIQYAYARALIGVGRFAEAKAVLDELLSDYADARLDASQEEVKVDDARYLRGWIELQKGDAVKAHEELMAVADETPESNRAAKSLMLANQSLMDHQDNALKIRHDPAHWKAERVDKQAEIKANLDRAMALYPDDPVIPRMLQDYIVYQVWRPTPENRAELVSVAEYIRENYPGTPYAEYALEELVDEKILHGDEADRQAAGEILEERIAAAITEGDIRRAVNWMYYKTKLLTVQRRYGEVRQVVAEALELMPDAPIRFELGLQAAFSYRGEGDHLNAREAFWTLAQEEAGTRYEESISLYYHAKTYMDAKDLRGAVEHLRQVAEEYPDLNAGAIAANDARRYEYALRAR